MIRKILFLYLIVFVYNVFPQISISSSDYAGFYQPGKSWAIFPVDTFSGVTMNIGEASTNKAQTWVLPVVQFTDTLVFKNILPSASPLSKYFRDATNASVHSTGQGGDIFDDYIFYKINNDVVIYLGTGLVMKDTSFHQINNDTLFHSPLTLGSRIVRRATPVDTLGVLITSEFTETVDAYGTVNILGVPVDALRATAFTILTTSMAGHVTNVDTTKEIYFISKLGTASIHLKKDSPYSGTVPILGMAVTIFNLPVSVDRDNPPAVKSYALYQNYPNPFNPVTVISYQLSVISDVELKVFDMLGREVVVLVNKEQSPGVYNVKFDGSNLSSGMYMYRLKAGDYIQSRKMLLMK